MVSLLDEYTPPEDDLKHCETPADAWKILTNKYANSTVVSAKLIHEYMTWVPNKQEAPELQLLEIEKKVRLLYLDLKAIKEENQLIYTPYFIEHAMEHIPAAYRNEVLRVQLDNKSLAVPKSNYEVITDYLATKKEAIELFGAYILNKKSKPSNNDPSKTVKYCHQCKTHAALSSYIFSLSTSEDMTQRCSWMTVPMSV